MSRLPSWWYWAALAWFLAELILAAALTRWYVDLLIDQAHRL